MNASARPCDTCGAALIWNYWLGWGCPCCDPDTRELQTEYDATMARRVSLVGVDPVEVIQALYHVAWTFGYGAELYESGPLPQHDARDALHGKVSFNGVVRLDYIKGRRIKADLSVKDAWLDPHEFDEMYGQGSGQRVVDAVRRGEALL